MFSRKIQRREEAGSVSSLLSSGFPGCVVVSKAGFVLDEAVLPLARVNDMQARTNWVTLSSLPPVGAPASASGHLSL